MIEGWKHLKFWKHGYRQVVDYLLDHDHLPVKGTFKALELAPYDSVKCVILGQDPYPTKGHAMGLAFSVLPHIKPPPSLRNIFVEYSSDLGYPTPRFGDLTPWAKEGVLLLNSVLTVQEGKPGSHSGIGWEGLTYEIIRSLATKGGVVFNLWGKSAKEYQPACETSPTICTTHPSPFSADKGFFGSRPFSRTNAYLKGLGVNGINWRLP